MPRRFHRQARMLRGRGVSSILSQGVTAVVNLPTSIPAALRGARDGASPAVLRFLENEGSQPVQRLILARKPVVKTIQKVLNILSLGGFEKIKDFLGYDDVYHNYLLAQIGGRWYRIEKNHVVEMNHASGNDFEQQQVEIKLPSSPLTITQMMLSAEQLAGLPKAFFHYDSRRENCQLFTKQMLQASHLTAPAEMLEPQNSVALIASLCALQGLPKAVTDLAARGDIVLQGRGQKK